MVKLIIIRKNTLNIQVQPYQTEDLIQLRARAQLF